MQVAFVTYNKLPDLCPDDQILAAYLSKRNIVVVPAVWDNVTVNWKKFDVIILRSMWDYFEKPDEFNNWIDKLEKLNCNVLNPLSVVKWNLDKNYFDILSGKGIMLPSYVISPKGSNINLRTIMEEQNWAKAVVKPTISGGAYNTWIASIENVDADETRFTELLQTGDTIVQVFVEEIITRGELSLIFFNKKFSHAICKKARLGDFRVQTQFGGTAQSIVPGEYIIEQAADLLNSIDESLLYARVDAVVTNDDTFLLMELELIEPLLSFFSNEKSCGHFYNSLLEIAGHPL